MVRIDGFQRSLAYDIKIACQNYLTLGRIVKFSDKTPGYRTEAWYQTALRTASWFTVVLPIGAKITLCAANHFAKKSIQERKIYWSRDIAPRAHFLKESRKDGFHHLKMRETFIHHLAHSGVPKKIAFDQIYFHEIPIGKSYLVSGNDTAFDNNEMPAQGVKSLHLYCQQSENEHHFDEEFYELFRIIFAERHPNAKVLTMTRKHVDDLKKNGFSNEFKKILAGTS